jgi:hypothetical protein
MDEGGHIVVDGASNLAHRARCSGTYRALTEHPSVFTRHDHMFGHMDVRVVLCDTSARRRSCATFVQ